MKKNSVVWLKTVDDNLTLVILVIRSRANVVVKGGLLHLQANEGVEEAELLNSLARPKKKKRKREKGKKRGRVPGLPVCLPTIPYYSVETHKWKQIGHEIKSKLTLSIRVDLTPNSAGQITCNQMNQRERWRKRSTGHALPTLVPAREGWLKFWALSDFNNRVHTFGCRSQRWNTQTLHCRIWSWITLEFLQFVGFFFFPVRFPNHSHVTQCRLAM